MSGISVVKEFLFLPLRCISFLFFFYRVDFVKGILSYNSYDLTHRKKEKGKKAPVAVLAQ